VLVNFKYLDFGSVVVLTERYVLNSCARLFVGASMQKA